MIRATIARGDGSLPGDMYRCQRCGHEATFSMTRRRPELCRDCWYLKRMDDAEVVHMASTQFAQAQAEHATFARVLAQNWVPVSSSIGWKQDDPPGVLAPNGSDAKPTRSTRMEDDA